MKKLIPLLLIWLTFSSISILENIWKNSKIAIPYRIDLFNNEGILFREDLLPIRKENPDWDICGEIETYGKLTLDINNNVGISVLAVSPDYLKYNPVNIIRGDFFLDGALIIQRDAAYNHFNTDDIVGDVLLFNDEPHIVAGIYDFSPLMKELSPCLPDVIVSINNTTINKNNISLLQIVSGSKINAGELNPYLNVPGQKNLELNLRFQLLKQLKNFLYIPLGVLIIISLLKILCKDILERRQIYRDNHIKYYRFQSIKSTLKYKSYVYILIIFLLIVVLILLKFKPYLPPEIISDITLKKIVLSPVKFILNKSLNSNPIVVLPQILESISFCIILFLYIPGIIFLYKINKLSLGDCLIIPALNIVFTIILLFQKLEPVFDFKANMLLFLFIIAFKANELNMRNNIDSANSNLPLNTSGQ